MDKVADIEQAIGAHAIWMSYLRQAVLDARHGIDVQVIRADDQCEFGKWLYGSRLSTEDRDSDGYREVRALHIEFHETAAQVVELAACGKTVEAYALLYGDYITLSGKLALAMRAWQEKLLKAAWLT